MADIRVRFKRVAEAFDGVARARLCESSGSEHSPENYSLDLSDLVESFFEREGPEEGENGDDNGSEVDSLENETKRGECDDQEENDRSESESESESKELLRGLLFGGGDQDDDDDQVKESVRAEVERASRVVGDGPERPGFKRRVMTRLRERGFDAGLCKSKWERNGRVPSGSYEYIDVNVAGRTRYIIELSLPGEFTIARPTPKYTSLLQNFPPIFLGKVEDLKQIVRLMSNEIRGSLKSVNMHVPPWRRHVYMQVKWFGSYRRTTNEMVEKTGPGLDAGSGKKRWVGFAPVPGVSYCSREGFGGKGGVKMGKLAMEFIGNGACVTVNSSTVD